MKMHIMTASICSMILSLLLLGGCSAASVRPEASSAPSPAWPEPPEHSRIRFVGAVTRPEDLNIRPALFRKVLDFLIGGRERTLKTPYGVEIDRSGKIYVVDTSLKAVHAFDIKGNRYYRFPARSLLHVPVDIAVDNQSGVLYVSDSNDKTIKMFKEGGEVFSGEIGKGTLERPTGIAVNEKTSELLVVDTARSQILRYDLESHALKGDFGGSGASEGKLHYPTHISVSRDGTILITDALNSRIQIFSPEGIFLRGFGRAGDAPGCFGRPRGVAADSDGNIYVVDALFDHVQIFDSGGGPLMAFGKPGNGPGDFWLPAGICIGENDRIYIADVYNRRVQIFQYLK